MATLFLDNFTGTDGTLLTAHTPDTGTGWTTDTGQTSPVISNANRCRTSGTGASNRVVAGMSASIPSHAYSVTAVVRFLASGGAGGGKMMLWSHLVAGNSGGVGYRVQWTMDTGNWVVFRNGVSMGGTLPTLLPTAAADYTVEIQTSTSGSNLNVDVYCQRASDNYYLKYDNTWTATRTQINSGGPLVDTSPLAIGTGGLDVYEYVGNSVGVQFDSFSITNPVTGATLFGISGPSSGVVGSATSNFTLTPDGTVTSATVTPTDGGGGGTFSPSSLTWTAEDTAKTFTYTPGSTGTKTISASFSGSPTTLSPSSLSVTVTSPATSFSFTGPSSAISGVASSNFTVTPNGTVGSATVTPSDGAGGTFSPSSLSWTTSSAAKTFTYTPATSGTRTVSVSTTAGSPSTISPSSLSVSVTALPYAVFLGDSNFDLGNSTPPGADCPGAVLAALGSSWSGSNRGISGWGFSDLTTDLTNWVNSAFDATRKWNIAILMCGTNGIQSGAAGQISALQAYLSAIKTAEPRWKIGVVTLPYSSTYQGNCDTYNAWIKANATSNGADFVVDTTGDGDLMSTVSTAYNDGLHLTDVGRRAEAGYIVAAMLRYIDSQSAATPIGVSRGRLVNAGA